MKREPARKTNHGLQNVLTQTLLGSVAVNTFGILTSVMLARFLEAEGRGVLASYILFASVFSAIAQMGMPSAFVYVSRTISGYPSRRVFYFTIVTTALSAAAFSGAFSAVYPHGISAYTFAVCGATFAAYQAMLLLTQAIGGLKAYNLINAATTASILACTAIGLLVFDFDPIYCFYLQIAAYAIFGIPLALSLHSWTGETANDVRIDSRAVTTVFAIKHTIRAGLGFYGVSLVGMLIANLDKLILVHLGRLETLGLYVAAYSVTRVIGVFQNAISVALYSNLAGQPPEEILTKVCRACRATFIPLLAFACILSFFSERIVTVAFGETFAGASTIFAILIFESVTSGASWTLSQYFNAIGKSHLVMARQIASLIPIFAIIPFLNNENSGELIALGLLTSSVFRLILTLVFLRLQVRRTLPRLYPGAEDLTLVLSIICRTRSDKR